MNIHTKDIELTECDREAIHHISAIQDFGALIAVTNDWNVAHRSKNIAEIVGDSCAPEIGDPLADYFSSDAIAELRRATSSLFAADTVERLFGVDLRGDGNLFDCAVHQSNNLLVIEIEPHEVEAIDRGLRIIRPVVSKLEQHDSYRSLGDEACHFLRDMLGYDRVMFYRFLPDESGQVIAEAKRDDLETYLDLRYPQADIPQQARALFVRNRFRIIADMSAPSIPVEPAIGADGVPLDMSMSTLRAHSQMHVEYMRNMGVGASLAISIVIDGKLWGMFACHHHEARSLSYGLRTVAELFSELVSLVIERLGNRKEAKRIEASRELHDRLIRSFADGAALSQSLPSLDPIISRAIDIDGISIFIDGSYNAKGHAPTEEEFLSILPQLNASADGRLIITDNLAEKFPGAGSFPARVAGAIILSISRRPRDYFILWRREELQNVTWAGKPGKLQPDSSNGNRISPRKSFGAWEQTMRGRSREWSHPEQKLAESLRSSLLEVILRLTDEQAKERARAQQQQELLIAELNHRVRNILNLIRGLINQSRGEAVSIDDFSEIVGGRISALALAHDNITKGNWSSAPLSELINSEADAYLAGKTDRVLISGPEALINPEAYTVLALVIHEMITNSAKYGALSDSSGVLKIGIEKASDGALELSWKEIGGPPVQAPERRGFGSTIVERSIPFELNGEAEVRFELSGVEARWCIPAKYVSWGETRATVNEQVQKEKDIQPTMTSEPPKTVLLVEDSMLIALDTEDCLKDLGVTTVLVESTVQGAIETLADKTPDAAILDYNLGSENSEGVAEALAKRGIPFWLATGYGEMKDRAEVLGASGLLTKPYGRDELTGLLAAYAKQKNT